VAERPNQQNKLNLPDRRVLDVMAVTRWIGFRLPCWKKEQGARLKTDTDETVLFRPRRNPSFKY